MTGRGIPETLHVRLALCPAEAFSCSGSSILKRGDDGSAIKYEIVTDGNRTLSRK